MASFALAFGPAEYFSLTVFGLLCATILASGSVIKAIGMICIGLLLSWVGTDRNSGSERLTFGAVELFDGIEFVVIAVGLFGIAEIIVNLEKPESRGLIASKISSLWPSREEFRKAWPAVLRGTGLGTFLGILPVAARHSAPSRLHAGEKRFQKTRRNRRGAVQGVAGPEAANNAGAQSSFIPLLTLGIPPMR